jgi:hypothetical protein
MLVDKDGDPRPFLHTRMEIRDPFSMLVNMDGQDDTTVGILLCRREMSPDDIKVVPRGQGRVHSSIFEAIPKFVLTFSI